jgi:hypothetical protein
LLRSRPALVAAVAAFGTGNAFAYGHADQPIAQVEISGNCNNPGFALCQEVGLGGVWAWAELDSAGGSTSGGSMDFTIAFCGHSGPGGGPHSAGGGGGPGEGVWQKVDTLGEAFALGGAPFSDTSVTYSAYYVLGLPLRSGALSPPGSNGSSFDPTRARS